eukprot:TRINITY_DN12741_c0_g1_i8.p1 TRINITY_DN12741_c0_g1~~TRINITY_DN12741_c0_g1_i8.p1  ORF type:complete len:380 (-),score=125.60 TRINITY_DN12741_c0_g1_i8:103-1242(-)
MKDYKQLAKEVFNRINYARGNPSGLTQELVAMTKKFSGNVYDGWLRTQEGAAAVLEAINFLEAQAPLPPILLHEGLHKVAQDFADELGHTGNFSHKDKNGQGAATRISKVVNWTGSMSECLSIGSETAEDIVNWWIIDDGTPSRGHRKNIFARTSKLGGVGCAAHPKYKVVAVLDLIEAVDAEARLAENFEPSSNKAKRKDYKKLAEEVLDRINYSRTTPQKLIPEFTEMTKKFKDNLYNNLIRTHEGVAAVQEALEFLKAQQSLPPIKLHEGLEKAAEDFANEMSETGNFSHKDKFGQGPAERIAKVAKVKGELSESLSLGSEAAADIVNFWIIDDGVPSRGHRRNLFSANAKLGGVGCAPHPKMRLVAVFNTIDGEA